MTFTPADFWPPGPPTGGAALDQTARDAAAAAQATANAAVSTGAELSPLLADPGATVDFTGGATGFIARTVQAKGADQPLTPYDFGAFGNGIVDDGPALRKWRDACNGRNKRGELPPGTYLLKTWETVTIGAWASKKVGLNLTVGVSVRGQNTAGSVIKVDPAIASQLDVAVLCNWSGQGTTRNVTVGGFGVDCQGKADIGLMFYGGSDNHASEIAVVNAAAAGVVLDGAQNLICMHVQATDCPVLWKVLNAATSSHLIRCEGRRATSKHLLVDNDSSLPGYALFTNAGTVPPVNTSFYGCIWEECSGTGVTRIADIQQGDQLYFTGCFFVTTENTSLTEIVYNKSLRILMENCRHVSTGVTVAVPALRIGGGAAGGFGTYHNFLAVGLNAVNAIDIETSTLWNDFLNPQAFATFTRLINTPTGTVYRYAIVRGHRTHGGSSGFRPVGIGAAMAFYENEGGWTDRWDPFVNRWRAHQDHKALPSSGTTLDIDLLARRYAEHTCGAGPLMVNAPTNAAIDDEFIVEIIQDGTGGRAVTWNAAYKVAWSDAGNTAGKRSTIRLKAKTTGSFVQLGAQSPYV